MEFTTRDLLKNASFSAKHYSRFAHYMTLLNLSKGIVPANVNVESIKELEKLNFKIDPLTDHITNIFDYNLYIKDNSPHLIYVQEVGSKQLIGTIKVEMFGDDLRLIGQTTSNIITGCDQEVLEQ
ncbi:asb135 [Agrotis segetum nucleopolyhedrovirus B]|uniref:Asb135 n=1 Tax=Agrotis segetum nucleopolyhedrovirus B TaxID=1580580 RepID=A0A0A7KRK0_9ABAC|nr:asb135 [Agrotis segetum nucleopolyhedrovirus B]AIZ48692.1 asb135 [Agrotis segetum nucleopolyhedrovirus B]